MLGQVGPSRHLGNWQAHWPQAARDPSCRDRLLEIMWASHSPDGGLSLGSTAYKLCDLTFLSLVLCYV